MKRRFPKLERLNDGRAYIRVNVAGKRKKIYFGKYGTPESEEAYREYCDDLTEANECSVDSYRITLDDLALRFMAHADRYYRKDGKPTSEPSSFRSALKPLLRMYGATPVISFGPLKLDQVRDQMIELGWKRMSINKQCGRIRTMIKWGVANELVPARILHGLQSLTPLKSGRTNAVESEKKPPVSVRDLIATCRELSPLVRSMVIVQARTAMRPSELLSMTLEQIDRSGPVWIYKPASHKTEHHGKEREILIGRKAQRHILRWVIANQQAAIFRSDRPNVGDPYGVDGYRNAIYRAAKRAGISESSGRRWSPGRLRHTGATMITKRADMETARVICGQSNIGVTERHYAEVDRSKAMRVMAKFG